MGKISKTNITKRLSMWAVVVAAILAIPLLAKFPWTLGDFIFAGAILFGAASAYEITTGNMTNKMHRVAVGAAAAFIVLLIWAWAVA